MKQWPLILRKQEMILSMEVSNIRFQWFHSQGIFSDGAGSYPYAFHCLIQKNKRLVSPELVSQLFQPKNPINPQLN